MRSSKILSRMYANNMLNLIAVSNLQRFLLRSPYTQPLTTIDIYYWIARSNAGKARNSVRL